VSAPVNETMRARDTVTRADVEAMLAARAGAIRRDTLDTFSRRMARCGGL